MNEDAKIEYREQINEIKNERMSTPDTNKPNYATSEFSKLISNERTDKIRLTSMVVALLSLFGSIFGLFTFSNFKLGATEYPILIATVAALYSALFATFISWRRYLDRKYPRKVEKQNGKAKKNNYLQPE